MGEWTAWIIERANQSMTDRMVIDVILARSEEDALEEARETHSCQYLRATDAEAASEELRLAAGLYV